MPAELVGRKLHRARFHRSDTTAAHGVVKHPVTTRAWHSRAGVCIEKTIYCDAKYAI